VAIFGPRSKANSEHIKSISDSMEIPYIETRWNYRSQDIIGEHSSILFSYCSFTVFLSFQTVPVLFVTSHHGLNIYLDTKP
jgi:hypothetical protein